MTLAGFERVIPGYERPQVHALDTLTTGIGPLLMLLWGKPYIDEHCRITYTFCCTRVETVVTLAQTPISACQKFCWVTPVNRFFCPGSLHEERDRVSLRNYVWIPLTTNNFYLKWYANVFTQTCHRIPLSHFIPFDILITCFFCDNCSVVSPSTSRSSKWSVPFIVELRSMHLGCGCLFWLGSPKESVSHYKQFIFF